MRKLLAAVPILALLLIVAPTHATRPAASIPEEPLGICFAYHDDPIWHELAREAGASFNRWQMSWYDVEPVQGQFSWSTYDDRVDIDLASGMAVNAILMGTPHWAATKGTRLAPLVRAESKEEPWTVQSLGKASTSASPPANLYSATKWAITGMAESIRKALVGTGVRTTLVSPGKVDTPFWDKPPDEPLLAPGDVARAVMFALSSPAGVDVSEVLVRPTGQAN
jgi:hypothetical protein